MGSAVRLRAVHKFLCACQIFCQLVYPIEGGWSAVQEEMVQFQNNVDP